MPSATHIVITPIFLQTQLYKEEGSCAKAKCVDDDRTHQMTQKNHLNFQYFETL